MTDTLESSNITFPRNFDGMRISPINPMIQEELLLLLSADKTNLAGLVTQLMIDLRTKVKIGIVSMAERPGMEGVIEGMLNDVKAKNGYIFPKFPITQSEGSWEMLVPGLKTLPFEQAEEPTSPLSLPFVVVENIEEISTNEFYITQELFDKIKQINLLADSMSIAWSPDNKSALYDVDFLMSKLNEVIESVVS